MLHLTLGLPGARLQPDEHESGVAALHRGEALLRLQRAARPPVRHPPAYGNRYSSRRELFLTRSAGPPWLEAVLRRDAARHRSGSGGIADRCAAVPHQCLDAARLLPATLDGRPCRGHHGLRSKTGDESSRARGRVMPGPIPQPGPDRSLASRDDPTPTVLCARWSEQPLPLRLGKACVPRDAELDLVGLI